MSDVGLYTALSGLQADQVALDAISQNLANVNTPGYVKTTVQMSAVPIAGVDSGVEVSGLTQVSDPTLSAASNSATGNAAYATANAATLSSIESAVPEPSTTGLSSQLTTLWSDIDSAANAAGSANESSANATVVSAAGVVASTLNSTAAQLQQVATSAQSAAASLITRDNSLLQQVASLNNQIAAADATPQGAGGLTTERNQAVSQLASDLGATVQNQANGSQTLYVGGVSIVQDGVASTLSLSSAGGTTSLMVQTASAPAITAPAVGNGQGGTLGAELDAVNTVIPAYQTQLNQVASSLAGAMNAALGGAYVGGGSSTTPAAASAQLFTTDGTTTTAANIAVNASVAAKPTLIGFSSSATTDDGAIAQQLAENASTAASNGSQTFTINGTTVSSPDTAWQQMVSVIGTASSQATTRATATSTAASNAQSALQSATGVDQNEELTTMLQIQSDYQASAKVLSTINDTIQSLLAAV